MLCVRKVIRCKAAKYDPPKIPFKYIDARLKYQEHSVNLDLSKATIKDLVNELIKRGDCVTELRPRLYEKYSISLEDTGTITDLGPAIILRIID